MIRCSQGLVKVESLTNSLTLSSLNEGTFAVQCSVQCLMYSMKCACSDSGVFAGAGAGRNVHCAVCRVQCVACQK